MAPRPRVVVVGGQFAGRRVKTLLQGACDVVLIDALGYIEYTPAVLRCLVEPTHIPSILVESRDVIHAFAHAVELNSGGCVPLHACVRACD